MKSSLNKLGKCLWKTHRCACFHTCAQTQSNNAFQLLLKSTKQSDETFPSVHAFFLGSSYLPCPPVLKLNFSSSFRNLGWAEFVLLSCILVKCNSTRKEMETVVRIRRTLLGHDWSKCTHTRIQTLESQLLLTLLRIFLHHLVITKDDFKFWILRS